jgi:hypothetical protein
MSFTDRQWRREYKRLPKWKELKEAYAEHKATMVAKVDRRLKK